MNYSTNPGGINAIILSLRYNTINILTYNYKYTRLRERDDE